MDTKDAPRLTSRVLPEEFDNFVYLWTEFKMNTDSSLEIRKQLMACTDLPLHKSMQTKTEDEILEEMRKLAVKDECRCSLDLGLHPFPTSGGEEGDTIQHRFPGLNNNIYKKAEEYYLNEGSPSFHLFPPSVRPETELGPFPPDDLPGPSKKNQEWSKRCEALNAEQKVAQLILSHFLKSEETGFFVHPFHTDTYLASIKDKAKNERKFTAKNSKCKLESLPLFKIEEDISECLGVDIKSIIIEKKEQNKIPEKKWQQEHIPFKCFQDLLNKTNFEIDNFLVVRKCLVNIEVKSLKESGAGGSSVKNVLTKAAKQLKNVNKAFLDSQRDILTDGWSFVRAIAMPNVQKEKIGEGDCCHHCKEFILDEHAVKNYKDGITNFLKLLPSKSCSSDPYKKLFSRLIGFYSSSEFHSTSVRMSLSSSRTESEKAIIGQKEGISSENPVHSLSQIVDDGMNTKGGGGSTRKKIRIYWNPSQIQLLKNAKKFKRVLLAADFGTGKTLLLKHFAAELSKQKKNANGKTNTVFFISFAAAENQDIKSISDVSAVIDVASELDFEGTEVQVIGAASLIKKFNNDRKAKSVNELLVRFMKENEGEDFLIDEIPVSTGDENFSGPDLTHLKGAESKDSYVWIVFRPENVENERHSSYDEEFRAYKEVMRQEDFSLPELEHNMRNSAACHRTMSAVFKSGFTYNKPVMTEASLPPNPVPGNVPVYVPAQKGKNMCEKHFPENLVVAAIQSYFNVEEEPIVIIVDVAETRMKVANSCKQHFVSLPVVLYSTSGDEEKDKLKQFLQDPEGILITDRVTFGGMQARNIVVVTGGFGRYVRNMLMRCIAQQIYIDTNELPDHIVHHLPLKVDRMTKCCQEKQ